MKVAFLWHQHQPDYFDGKSFLMPWVRFHAVKDYYDIPEIASPFSSVRQTFNIVPSMIRQLEMYAEGVKDEVQILTEIPADKLNEDEKSKILELFFRCNKKNHIFKHPRYKELFDKTLQESSYHSFETRDFLDLQVWYNLTWAGGKSGITLSDLFEKGSDFAEDDKTRVLNHHIDICKKTVSRYRDMSEKGIIELSCSPLNHPILPLLIDTNIARQSQSNLNLPDPPFQFEEDARFQISAGLKFHERHFGKKPDGMWPSEGSISEDTLRLMAYEGIKWTATDEKVLLFSGENLKETDKYFPHVYGTPTGDITIFFRDNELSDKIGFSYQNMHATAAVEDFLSSLNSIREKIIAIDGRRALDEAVVSVILDGENCWEYYDNNGADFLKELYSGLQKSNFELVTFSETVGAGKSRHRLKRIRAGSWINANFDIWIGSRQAKVAWELLTEARITLQLHKNMIAPENYRKAYDYILKAEGSDWFWWYCPYHRADNESDFDLLFRKNLQNVYEVIGVEIPENVFRPILPDYSEESAVETDKPQDSVWDYGDLNTWGSTVPELPENTVMHRVGQRISRIYHACQSGRNYIRIELEGEPGGEEIEFILEAGETEIHFTVHGITCVFSSGLSTISLKIKERLSLEFETLTNPDSYILTMKNKSDILSRTEITEI